MYLEKYISNGKLQHYFIQNLKKHEWKYAWHEWNEWQTWMTMDFFYVKYI